MRLKKQRGRHVASDEAHAWARSLPLNNPNAKTVLRALALYVNGEGCCFVGMEQLSEDTDLSADTVRRRMVWLEQVGAIVRLPQWLDANGMRNGEGRGKRTTDEVRLLLEADTDEIEARAAGDETAESSAISSTETTAISPSRQQGLTPDGETVGPQLAPRQPLQSCEGLISEPEPEDSPQPPSGGSVTDDDGFKSFEEDWEEPILRQSLARQVWAALTAEERTVARQAARGYVVWRKRERKPPNVLGAHLFLKERDAWPRFATLAPSESRLANVSGYDPKSPEGRAIVAMYAVARKSPFENNNRIIYSGEMTPQLLAFADVGGVSRWQWIEDRQQIGAWSNFLNGRVLGSRPPLVAARGIGEAQRSGIYAPWPWPPRKDGSLTATGPPETLMAEGEEQDFK